MVLQPEDDSWAVVVYDAPGPDAARLGTAVVIDDVRLLTCRHVIAGDDPAREQAWVAFPKAVGFMHRGRWPADVIRTDPDLDVAILRLPEGLPPGVAAPPLRCPAPSALRDKRWWAFGFAESRRGNSASGLVGESLGDGYVRIDADPDAVYKLRRGFSGGGVWSPDFGAVVGVVVTADEEHGNGEAVTLHQIDLCFPEEKIGELARWTAGQAGESALAAWGWRLDRDPEGVRHWRPRGRGVSADSERGFRFRGRRAALSIIAGWLDRAEADRRSLVVTGSPGAGKSAVLGRIVTTADPAATTALPPGDREVRATPGSVACAVHAKGKTALEVAAEIARAASAALPDQVEDFAPAMREALSQHPGDRFNVIIDAVDEATSPDQARLIITQVIVPLTETCADVGAQVIVGTRGHAGEADLLAAFGPSLRELDLDDPGVFAEADLAAYALATLRLEGDERAGNPYADESAAGPVATRIAELAGRNFLVAGLIARAHGLYDQHAANPAELTFTASVDAAMRQYLQRLPPVAGVAADALLTALAFAEAPGLPLELWQAAVLALGAGQVTAQQLAGFARSPAASFLIESGTGTGPAVFRLFHQALNDALRHAREEIAVPAEDQRALTRAFITNGRGHGWGQAPGYLLRSLPGHAAAGGVIDDLLTDDTYLLHADLRRLIPLADRAATRAGHQRARLLRLTPRAITADPANRAALFSVTETLENLGRSLTLGIPAPYRAMWAAAAAHTEWSILEGHTDWVNAVCALTVDGRTLLASGGRDQTVRIWDPVTGIEQATLYGYAAMVTAVCALTARRHTRLAVGDTDGVVRIWDPVAGTEQALQGHAGWVRAVCALTVDGRALLASAGDDQTVRIWDPVTGIEQAVLAGHSSGVFAVCAFTVGGRTLLASGGEDETVRIWDPVTGTEQARMQGHDRGVFAVCAFTVDGRTLLASGSDDRTVRIWDPVTGTEQAVLRGDDLVNAVCAFTMGSRTLLAVGGSDRTIRIWDPVTGASRAVLEGHNDWVRAMCALRVDGRTLLAVGGDDGTVRIWDPATGTEQAPPEGHASSINAIRAFAIGGRTLLASGGDDGMVRIWDPLTGTEQARMESHPGRVRAVSALTVDGRTLLASGGDEQTVRIWDPVTGAEQVSMDAHAGWVHAVCALTVHGHTLLAIGGTDRTVRIWDPDTGIKQAALEGHVGTVYAVCACTVDGRTLLASGGGDGLVRVWDPATGAQEAVLEGHAGWVNAVCVCTVAGRTLLASGGDDRMVRIWDPATGAEQAVLEGHAGAVHAVCACTVAGRTLLASGGDDRTVRIWDPISATSLVTMPVYYPVRSLDHVRDILVVAMTAGLLAVRLELRNE